MCLFNSHSMQNNDGKICDRIDKHLKQKSININHPALQTANLSCQHDNFSGTVYFEISARELAGTTAMKEQGCQQCEAAEEIGASWELEQMMCF